MENRLYRDVMGGGGWRETTDSSARRIRAEQNRRERAHVRTHGGTRSRWCTSRQMVYPKGKLPPNGFMRTYILCTCITCTTHYRVCCRRIRKTGLTTEKAGRRQYKTALPVFNNLSSVYCYT